MIAELKEIDPNFSNSLDKDLLFYNYCEAVKEPFRCGGIKKPTREKAIDKANENLRNLNKIIESLGWNDKLLSDETIETIKNDIKREYSFRNKILN